MRFYLPPYQVLADSHEVMFSELAWSCCAVRDSGC